MKNHPLEVADVLREHGEAYLHAYGHTISTQQHRVMRDLVRCRTAALGGHAEQCDQCGHRRLAYNSCRNRHCPKCQAKARAQWLDDRAAELLPTTYFHVVFTLPSAIGYAALQNTRTLYNLLFRATAETLRQIAADPAHLGAQIDFLAVLHTWGQSLHAHPHIHCVVPGGGLSPDGTKWIDCRDNFFLSVRVLSKLFRGKFLASLRGLFDKGELGFYGQQQHLRQPKSFCRWLDSLYEKDWVVYAKKPFGGPEQMLKYLACYTHRVAISNNRLLKMDAQNVEFTWKDYAQGNRQKRMTLTAVEFIRRFLLHTLPSGFVRIRHYGLFANRHRQEKIRLCRVLLTRTGAVEEDSVNAGFADEDHKPDAQRELTTSELLSCCPICKQGRMVIVEVLARFVDLEDAFKSQENRNLIDSS